MVEYKFTTNHAELFLSTFFEFKLNSKFGIRRFAVIRLSSTSNYYARVKL